MDFSAAKDQKTFLSMTPRQIILSAAIFFVCTVLVLYGFANNCFGWVVVAALLFMVPRMVGIKSTKKLAVIGLCFILIVPLVGAATTANTFMNENSGNPSDTDKISNIEYVYTDYGVEISAEISSGITVKEVKFRYIEVNRVFFGGYRGSNEGSIDLTEASGTISGLFEIKDSNKLYLGFIEIEYNDGEKDVKESCSNTFLLEAFDGSTFNILLYGCFLLVVQIMMFYFLMIVMTLFMNRRFEKMRDKMEAEGRLYPKGYGACDNCGALIVPTDLICRKCGATIDRPEEMKAKPKEAMTCSDCGATVSADEAKCPKCGARFDEDEPAEQRDEAVRCPDCNNVLRDGATFCPVCGLDLKSNVDLAKKE